MDISVYISELLWNHDCVIIPGFGGLIGNYRPAVIDGEQHIISPPSKALTFNRSLQSNDGLLVNHISHQKHLSFVDASALVQSWVESSLALLKNGETVTLKKVGVLSADGEGNIQFHQDDKVNYLKTSFGLRSITAAPVERKSRPVVDLKTVRKAARTSQGLQVWKIAATILLIAGIGALSRMMTVGVEIKPLQLDEAGVMNVVNRLFYVDDKPLNTIPIEADFIPVRTPEVEARATPPTVENVKPTAPAKMEVADKPAPAKTEPATISSGVSKGYFVIIGAFRNQENIETAKNKLLKDYPASEIFLHEKNGLTKVGYYAGTNESRAQEILSLAKQQDASCWLMHR